MNRRYVSVWLRYLKTDWYQALHPELEDAAVVFWQRSRGRQLISAINKMAARKGIQNGMVLADARALYPGLVAVEEEEGKEMELLQELALFCIRFTPVVAVDPPEGLLLDVSGCPHLWGGEKPYMQALQARLQEKGFTIRMAMADTIGCSWAIARFGKVKGIIEPGGQQEALLHLPPSALRMDVAIVERLMKLGLTTIGKFVNIPRSSLRRRFGMAFLNRMDQALGLKFEALQPVIPPAPYQERLPALEPIKARAGIGIALDELLQQLCKRLLDDRKGARVVAFKCLRCDNQTSEIRIGTGMATRNPQHLRKLFELKLSQIAPGLGIELFILDAELVEDQEVEQDALWEASAVKDAAVAELMDRLSGKLGNGVIQRFLPTEHYWPERSYQQASRLDEQPATYWRTDQPRPLQVLPVPELITVTAPIPDYPPMLFIYKGVIHKIKKADGPERIEREWWMDTGLQRDYYQVEDEQGRRYWIFRSGHYDQHEPEWYLHGFFA